MCSVVFDSIVTPDAAGYGDKIAVCNGRLLYHGQASCCPNWRTPWLRCGRHWLMSYAWVAPGEYGYDVIAHTKHGMCLRVNGGGRVATRNWNPVQRDNFMLGCLVHCGQTESWRGSAGCLTLPPEDWQRFMQCFALGQRGKLVVRRST